LHPTEIPLSWILLHSDKHFASTVVFAQFVFATACLRPFRASHSAKSALLEFPSGSLSLNFAPKVLKHFFRSVSRSPWPITLSLHPTEIPLSWILLHSDKHFASTVVFAQFVFAIACLRPFRASHSAKSAKKSRF